MISIAIFIISFVILGAILGAFTLDNYSDANDDFSFKQLIKTISAIVLSIVISVIQPVEIQRIDAGNIGLKIDRVGNDKGVPVAISVKGWVFYNSWMSDVVEYSVRQNHIRYNKFIVTTKGGTPMEVAPSFNYALKPEKGADVYINLLKGGDFNQLQETWILTATTIALKNATNEFPIDSIFNNQSIYQQAVEQELNKEMAKYFVVSQINPGQITPSSMASILQSKAQAIQLAQQAELDRKTADAEAYTKIAKARGDSAAQVIAASADAETIKLKTREISSNYVEYIKWSNWDGHLSQTVLGGNTTMMLNPSK